MAQLVLAAALAALSAWASVVAVPQIHMELDSTESHVLWVLPDGPLWKADVRPGQLVLYLEPGAEEREWRMETAAPLGIAHVDFDAITAWLRETQPFALGACALALAAVLAFARPRVATALAAASVFVAAATLEQSGDPTLVPAASLLALLLPAAWTVKWLATGLAARAAVVTAVGVVAAAWALAFLDAGASFDVAEQVRGSAAGAALVVMATGALADRRRFREMDPAPAVDLLVVLAVTVGAVLAVRVLEWPSIFVVALCVTAVAFYPRVRAPAVGAIEEFLAADVRRQAALAATEAERGHLAGELHDGPLQSVAAVVRRLEARPDAAAEVAVLRDASCELRRVATALRPPALDELGLGPALEGLVEAANASGPLTVTIAVTTAPGERRRPPRQVELAVYRIVQEAVQNASVHGGGEHVDVRADLGDSIAVTVTDDGGGFTPARAREARRSGRMGLASMRDRAAAIGATLRVDPTPTGTTVAVRWTPS
jgi:signal transduction histidine kinase